MSGAVDGVALTFDDGPDPVWTTAILDALDAQDLQATFFVIAPRATAHPQLLSRMRAEGHAIALHCYEHVRHSELSEEAVDADTTAALAALERLDVRPHLWRTPWGVVGEHSRRVARRHGLELVGWTADSEDWAGHDVADMMKRVSVDLVPGAIVLAHDGLGPGALRVDCENTVALVERLAWLMRVRGLGTRTLGMPEGATA